MSVDAISGIDNNLSDVSKKVINVVPSATSVTETSNNFAKKDIIDERKIKDALTIVNNKLIQKRTRCEYSYNEDVKRVSIKMYDCDTNEVIKEIPAEDTLEMLEKMWELAGLLIDEKR